MNKELRNAVNFIECRAAYIEKSLALLNAEILKCGKQSKDIETYLNGIKSEISDISDFIEAYRNKASENCDLIPFNLEEARHKPICTRDGRSARLICTDARNTANQCVVALVTDGYGESPISYDSKGRYDSSFEDGSDLFMLPLTREGWVNIYPNNTLGDVIFDSKRSAVEQGNGEEIDTIKIEWEE